MNPEQGIRCNLSEVRFRERRSFYLRFSPDITENKPGKSYSYASIGGGEPMKWSPKSNPPPGGTLAAGSCPSQIESCDANLILAGLPRPEVDRLWPAMSRVVLCRGHVVEKLAKGIDSLYFPLSGMIAIFTVMTDGRTVATAVTGREGFVGVPATLSIKAPPIRAVSLVAGASFELSAAKLPRLMSDNPQFATNLRRYCGAYLAQVAQIGACHALHTVQQRVALWLLLTKHYSQASSVPLTHEMLSELLGCRRSSVSEALSQFEDTGVIHGSRGEIEIAEPSRLASVACECYEILRVSTTSR